MSPPQTRRLSSPPTRTPSDRSYSPPRELSPPSRPRAPLSRSEQRQKHRLPTPRSSILVSPNYNYGWEREQARSGESEREVSRSRGDHYEPYRREVYRDREQDLRRQYFVMKPMIGIEAAIIDRPTMKVAITQGILSLLLIDLCRLATVPLVDHVSLLVCHLVARLRLRFLTLE